MCRHGCTNAWSSLVAHQEGGWWRRRWCRLAGRRCQACCWCCHQVDLQVTLQLLSAAGDFATVECCCCIPPRASFLLKDAAKISTWVVQWVGATLDRESICWCTFGHKKLMIMGSSCKRCHSRFTEHAWHPPRLQCHIATPTKSIVSSCVGFVGIGLVLSRLC